MTTSLRLRYGAAAAASLTPARRELVQNLDADREADRGVNVAPRDMKAGAVGDQRHADQQQEAECEHLHGRMPLHESGERPRCGEHDAHRDDDGGGHHPQSVADPDGGDHAVQGEHDVEHHDLRDDPREARLRPLHLGVLDIVLHGMVNLPRSLVEQEQAARDQNEVPPRD
jgi:hypothetical protein